MGSVRQTEKKARPPVSDGIDTITGNETDLIITLDTVNKVKHFCNICQASPVTATLYDGNSVHAAGDSIMSVFAISLLHPMRLHITGSPDDINSYIKKLCSENIRLQKYNCKRS